MVGDAPPFWWQQADWRAWALYPLSFIYGRVAARRLARAPRKRVAAPVLCVGNFTVGGSGKTPVAIALGMAAREAGRVPGFLSRGHGGTAGREPHLVDPRHDVARHVGDEPLLLAAHAPTVVTANREAGAGLLIEHGCDFVIMDDGFQSGRIAIDYALIVIDGRFGIGNGHVVPAGPLRAPLRHQLIHASAVLRMGGQGKGDAIVRQAARAGKPVFDAVARPREPDKFRGRRFFAFAGIGFPQKFFDTLVAAGGIVERKQNFADHHVYRADEVADLSSAAAAAGLQLITTSKDAARLANDAATAAFRASLEVLEIEARFDDPLVPRRIVEQTLRAWERRRLSG